MIGSFDVAILGIAAFAASLVGSVAGSGGTAVLLPILVIYFGVRDAIPILTIANLSSNLGRVWFNWREIVVPVVVWFALGAIPLALAGAVLFVKTPNVILTRILGAFLLITVAWRRFGRGSLKIHWAGWFAPLGAVFGLLAGLFEGVGPLMAPFFLAYGLVRGAYIGTDAMATVLMQVSKLAVFGQNHIIAQRILAFGLILVPFMLAGAFVGKKLVERISERIFVVIIDATLLFAGANFVLAS